MYTVITIIRRMFIWGKNRVHAVAADLIILYTHLYKHKRKSGKINGKRLTFW